MMVSFSGWEALFMEVIRIWQDDFKNIKKPFANYFSK